MFSLVPRRKARVAAPEPTLIQKDAYDWVWENDNHTQSAHQIYLISWPHASGKTYCACYCIIRCWYWGHPERLGYGNSSNNQGPSTLLRRSRFEGILLSRLPSKYPYQVRLANQKSLQYIGLRDQERAEEIESLVQSSRVTIYTVWQKE